jgi:hypothetical protein
VNNQFNLINDDDGISYQHDVRPVPNDHWHYTVFDNGNYHSPPYSRAFEFSLDTTSMTATKVWEYRNNPDFYSYFMGSVQRLPNGNTLIDWADAPFPKATEVTPEGEVVYEMNFKDELPVYRTNRIEWEGKLKVPYLIAESHTDKVSLIFNKFGDTIITEYRIYARTDTSSEQLLASTSETFINLRELNNNQTYYFRVTAVDTASNESGYSNEEEVYVSFIESGGNLILNGNFSQESEHWELEINENASAQGSVEDGAFHIQIDSAGGRYSDIQLRQDYIDLIENRGYILEFDAWSSETKIFDVRLQKSSDPFTDYSRIGAIYSTEEPMHYRYEFLMDVNSDYSAQIVFDCGQSDIDLYIDNVSLTLGEIGTDIEPAGILAESFKLYHNYPNPFNSSTIILFNLPKPKLVKLEVYNIIGQKIETLLNKSMSSGNHRIEFTAQNLSSGIYFYRFEAGEYQDVKKMILIR